MLLFSIENNKIELIHESVVNVKLALRKLNCFLKCKPQQTTSYNIN